MGRPVPRAAAGGAAVGKEVAAGRPECLGKVLPRPGGLNLTLENKVTSLGPPGMWSEGFSGK